VLAVRSPWIPNFVFGRDLPLCFLRGWTSAPAVLSRLEVPLNLPLAGVSPRELSFVVALVGHRLAAAVLLGLLAGCALF
jgi:hypothetical protein